MHDVIAQRLAQCKQQLEHAVVSYNQTDQRLAELRTEIVGLQHTIKELEALTQQVVVALPQE